MTSLWDEHRCNISILHTPRCILYGYVAPDLVLLGQKICFHTFPAQLSNLMSNEPVFTYWRALFAFGFHWLCFQGNGNIIGVQGLDHTSDLLCSNQSHPSLDWLQFQPLPVHPHSEETIRAQPSVQRWKNHTERKQKNPPQKKKKNRIRIYWSLILECAGYGGSVGFLR